MVSELDVFLWYINNAGVTVTIFEEREEEQHTEGTKFHGEPTGKTRLLSYAPSSLCGSLPPLFEPLLPNKTIEKIEKMK